MTFVTTSCVILGVLIFTDAVKRSNIVFTFILGVLTGHERRALIDVCNTETYSDRKVCQVV